MKVSPWLIAALVALGLWAYFGFPSPETLASWPSAKDQCSRFAEENRAKLFSQTSAKIEALDSWLKNGRVVVELGAFEAGSRTYTPRICVVGGGHIQIVSLFENNAWR